MFAHLILSEFFRSLRRHFWIACAEQYAANYSIIDADFQWWNTLLSISGYCANVQIAEKLVSCTWRKLWFSCWNDRTKNIGITYPANKSLHVGKTSYMLETLCAKTIGR
jgi:hypothetical protein